MRSILFHIPAELFGVPVFGFGWLLGLWALVSAGWLAWSARRIGWRGETQSLAAFLLLAGALIAFVLPAISDAQGLPVRGYGVMLLAAVVVSAWVAIRRAQALGVDPDLLYSLMFWLVATGVIGARLFYLVQYWDQFRDLPPTRLVLELVNVTEGGLVVYGGLLGGALTFFWFAHRHRMPSLALADLVAPSVALGMGIGRIGCFLNGCCYGGPSDLPWAVTFPAGSPPFQHQFERGEIYFFGLQLPIDPEASPVVERVEPNSPAAAAGVKLGDVITGVGSEKIATTGQALLALIQTAGRGGDVELTLRGRAAACRWTPDRAPRSLPVHPTQLYSAIDAMLLGAFLWAYYPFRRRDGEVLALLLTLHPISRFLLEIIRQDEGSFLGTGLTISQTISVAIFLTGLALWVWIFRRPARTAWPVATAA